MILMGNDLCKWDNIVGIEDDDDLWAQNSVK